jgi:hypothetical protein
MSCPSFFVVASEAQQSSEEKTSRVALDRFVAALLAMTGTLVLRHSGAREARARNPEVREKN